MLSPEQIMSLQVGALQGEMSMQTEEQRRQYLYTILCKAVTVFETMGLTPADVTFVMGAVYLDRKNRLTHTPLPAAHELEKIFAELAGADPDTERLLAWVAKNVNRFSRFSLEHPGTHTTLQGLMEAKGLALRDRNPSVLRAVIELALREYVARGYDQPRLQNVLRISQKNRPSDAPRV